MFRLLISGLAAVLIHLVLIGLPARHHSRPAPVSEPENAIRVTISHVRPEPEKKVLPAPVPKSKPKAAQNPKKERPPEKKAPKPAEAEKPRPVPAPVATAEPTLQPETDPAREQEPPSADPDPGVDVAEPETETRSPPLPDPSPRIERSDVSSPSGQHPGRRQAHSDGVHKEAVPLYKDNPLPRYPKSAQLRGHSGTVLLMVLVGETGKPQNIWVFESSGYKSLDDEAVRTVLTWLFEPGTVDGRPKDMWVKIPVTFELKKR